MKNITNETLTEIDRLKSLSLDAEDGATFNLDGTKYTGDGLVVPVASINLQQSELAVESLVNFMRENANKLTTKGNFKFGLYKFPNSNQMSIDLNIVIEEIHRNVALEFGRLAGQESLYNLGTFNNEKTGATGGNPRSFTPKQIKEIAVSLNNGKLPKAVL